MSKRKIKCLLFSLALLSLHESTFSHLDDTFYRFHELRSKDIRIRVKRNALGKLRQKRVTFDAYGRNFELLLKPGSPVLAKDSKLDAVYGNGTENTIDVNMDEVYHGKLAGDKRSWISAVVETSVWTALIYTSSDAYYIEPRVNHDPDSAEDAMILYRFDDVRTPNASDDGRSDSFCGLSDFPDEDVMGRRKRALQDWVFPNEYSTEKSHQFNTVPSDSETENDSESPVPPASNKTRGSRHKRYSADSNTCEMLVIADSRAYEGIGRKNIHHIAKLLVAVYDAIDSLFKRTHFGRYKGVRLKIREMKIFTQPFTTHFIGRYMLMSLDPIGDIDLLTSMSRVHYFKRFCLGHLTTERLFKMAGVLGVASRAQPHDPYWANGLCGSTYYFSRNVGLSTTINGKRHHLTLRNYMEVVAHELGHTFGARHDDGGVPRCAPSAEDGGKYLMWYRATVTYNPNHFRFSTCSIEDIRKILEIRGPQCFKDDAKYRRSQCGNGILEEVEECDVGENLMEDPLKCCRPDCILEANATCSPNNHPCCTDKCTVASKKQTCVNNVKNLCSQTSFCDGESFEKCPIAPTKPDGSPCQGEGKCFNGQCKSYCALVGEKMMPRVLLAPCNCIDSRRAMCVKCCMDIDGGGKCRAFGGYYPEGTPCLLGVCTNHTCLPISRPESEDIDLGRLPNRQEEYPLTDNLHIFLYTICTITLLISAAVLVFLHKKQVLACGQPDDLSELDL